jgi:putative hydrolase of the HAD superfamily
MNQHGKRPARRQVRQTPIEKLEAGPLFKPSYGTTYPFPAAIRAILFDLDNTLFDHEASTRATVHGFLQYLGVEPSKELTQAWFEIENRVFERYLANELSLQEHRRERLREFLPLTTVSVPTESRQLDELFTIFLKKYEHSWVAFPDALPTLQQLRASGMPVAVVTNGDQDQQTAKIQRTGLSPFVGQIFSSNVTGYAKPASEAFRYPCQHLQVAPAEALYVGDNHRVDIEGARNAGLQAIFIQREGARCSGAIRTLTDLLSLLGTTPTSSPPSQVSAEQGWRNRR